HRDSSSSSRLECCNAACGVDKAAFEEALRAKLQGMKDASKILTDERYEAAIRALSGLRPPAGLDERAWKNVHRFFVKSGKYYVKSVGGETQLWCKAHKEGANHPKRQLRHDRRC